MNYLSGESLGKSYNEKWLFQDLNFGISKGEKIGLVGANGAGKSTLFQILSGKLVADRGHVAVSSGITVGYLDQDPEFPEGITVMEALFSSESPSLIAIKEYEDALNNSEDSNALQKAMEKMDALNAWDYESKVKQIIGKMGITILDQKIKDLSGGQKKRIALARLLIESPDLLILDEPTNHLDLDTVEWLEGFLSTSNTTLLLVTHDRYFLDRVTNEIVELDGGKIYRYKGNYSFFLEKKAERLSIEQAETDKANNLLRKELEWMRRQPKARGTKAKSRVDAFYELEEKAGKTRNDQSLELKVETSRQGNKVIEIDHISKTFAKPIIDDFSYVFKKKDRIGIIGKNGSGKSTFLNIITGKIQPDSGKIDAGSTTKIGYFSQTGLDFKEDQRVIDIVKEVAEHIPVGNGETLSASQFLQKFLFPPAVQYTYVNKLSGGEKKRLQLLRVLISNPNFLILDEPTNDLDIPTLNVLESFLMGYEGSLVIVSHDRYFMDKLIDHVFIFDGSATIKDFPGNYTDYRNHLEESEKQTEGKSKEKPKEKPVEQTPPSKPAEEKKKLSFKEKQEFETLEKEIEKLEKKKTELTDKLSSSSISHDELTKLSQEFENVNNTLEEKTLRWLELSEKA